MLKRTNANVCHELNETECDTGLDRSPATTAKNDIELASERRAEESGRRPRTDAMRKKEKWHLFALCFALFVAGWDGGTAGPLLVRMQEFYHV